MKFCVLSSGSKANVSLIEHEGSYLLLDCGLPLRVLEERLLRVGVDPQKISAVLISHEHQDHIRTVARFSNRYRVPVYCNRGAKKFLKTVYSSELFTTGTVFSLGKLEIETVKISHDAHDPVGFIFRGSGSQLAHITDLGTVNDGVETALMNSDAVVLESNHDPDLLWGCEYPWHVKNRISSSYGHLSNGAAAALLARTISDRTQVVILAHLSERSNNPELALSTVREAIPSDLQIDLRCASVHQETGWIDVKPSISINSTAQIELSVAVG